MFDRSSSTRVDPRGIALATSVATQPRQLSRTYPRWELIALAALLVLELGLDCVNLAPNGFGNTYYAAAVGSMLANWHRFFFVSFDSGGFLMVDKPPVGLWVQTLSASALGFSGVSLILPQAIAGVLSVAVLYHLVRRTFGGPAGLLAGALLAISPINVVANRSNVMDSLLVLTTLLAVWALFRATETGQFAWLAVGAVLIGLGFNIKMLEAYIVLPACVLLYLVGSRQTWKVRLGRMVLAGVILTAVSLCWVAIVQSTPPTQRPYVDSTLTNSELDLAFNYNGAQRLFGEPSYGKKPTATISDAGLPGPLRLFQVPLGGQVSWLLPLALVGLLASIWEMRPLAHGRGGQWWLNTPRQRAFVVWAMWLLTAGVFFSAAQFLNRYYLVMLAPAVCALAGIGAVALWRDFRRADWRWTLLPIAVLVTGAEQVVLLAGSPGWSPWLLPTIVVATGASVMTLTELRLARDRGIVPTSRRRWVLRDTAVPSLVVAVLIVAPLFWLAASFTARNEGGFPVSGPLVADQSPQSSVRVDPKLIRYLTAHAADRPFLVATVTTQSAAPIMLATRAPVMAMGGYSGYDPILTPRSLATLVGRGIVRFFWLPATNLTVEQQQALYPPSPGNAVPFATKYTNRLTQWVSQNCRAIPPQEWKATSELEDQQLFDCGAHGPV